MRNSPFFCKGITPNRRGTWICRLAIWKVQTYEYKACKEFDIQDYLIQSESSPQAFFKACVEEDPGDGSLVRIALIELAKTRGVVQLKASQDSVCGSVPSRRISKIQDDV